MQSNNYGADFSEAKSCDWQAKIDEALRHFEDVFEDMRQCADALKAPGMPHHAADYEANFINQYIATQVAELYAKDPTIVFEAREQINHVVWDGSFESLAEAMQIQQQAQQVEQAMMAMPGMLQAAVASGAQPMDLMQMQQQMLGSLPQLDPTAVQEAQAIVAEAHEEKVRKQLLRKAGKTMKLLIEYFWSKSKPEFAQQMRDLACTALVQRVGVLRLDYKRKAIAPLPNQNETLTSGEALLQSSKEQIVASQQEATEAAEIAQQNVRRLREGLQNKKVIEFEEGPVWTFPNPVDLVFDPNTRNVRTFKGCSWIAQQHRVSKEQLKALWGVEETSMEAFEVPGYGVASSSALQQLYKVWEIWDKTTHRVYIVCGGKLLAEFPPPVKLRRFFPFFIWAPGMIQELNGPYPDSVVSFLLPMQQAINDSRQRMRKHQWANRPAMAYMHGALDPDDIEAIVERGDFSWLAIKMTSDQPDLQKVLQPLPTVRPETWLYDTGIFREDAMYATGASAEDAGAFSQLTATQSNISATQRAGTNTSKELELDTVLSQFVVELAYVLQQEYPEEAVKAVVGKGAVWFTADMPEADQLVLGLEAGSSGAPNLAKFMQGLGQLWPMISQLPDINHQELVKKIAEMLKFPLGGFFEPGAQPISAGVAPGPGISPGLGNVPGAPV